MLRASAFDSGSNFKPKNSKEKTLADLFQPPMDLMVHLPFDEVIATSVYI